MRPGPIRPGDAGERAGAPDGAHCFNEARADSPGRSTESTASESGSSSFNEARADSPGR